MNAKSLTLMGVLVAFGALSTLALVDHGYWGILESHFPTSAGWQVLTDLVIVCTLAMIWMVLDARRTGRAVWPYLLLTLVGGSFGPLLYLLIGELSHRESRATYAGPVRPGVHSSRYPALPIGRHADWQCGR